MGRPGRFELVLIRHGSRHAERLRHAGGLGLIVPRLRLRASHRAGAGLGAGRFCGFPLF